MQMQNTSQGGFTHHATSLFLYHGTSSATARRLALAGTLRCLNTVAVCQPNVYSTLFSTLRLQNLKNNNTYYCCSMHHSQQLVTREIKLHWLMNFPPGDKQPLTSNLDVGLCHAGCLMVEGDYAPRGQTQTQMNTKAGYYSIQMETQEL